MHRKLFFFVFLVVGSGLLVAGAARARDDFLANSATIDFVCYDGGDGVMLTVTHTVSDAYPTDWVGWYVERETVGACVPDVQICEVLPFPDQLGQTAVVLTDFPGPGRNVVYRILARTADGGHVGIYTGARMAFFHSICLGGPAFRGTIELYAVDFPYFAPCPEECWFEISVLDTMVPADLAELAGTGIVVDIFGTLASGMEGTRLDIDFWLESTQGCIAIGGFSR